MWGVFSEAVKNNTNYQAVVIERLQIATAELISTSN